METVYGHLTYCSNIHPGEHWNDHFAQLQQHIPFIKSRIVPDRPFGIGLRLSNLASLELIKQENLQALRNWLSDNDCYVFTMNGFPYGGFHHTVVKDQVHAPDWTTNERVDYTVRLAKILAGLLPDGQEGGISTSPLSYCFWHKEEKPADIFRQATLQLLRVVEQLIVIKKSSGKIIHLDIEPEPDGLLGEGKDFFEWFSGYLLPLGTSYLREKFRLSDNEADSVLKEHVQLCYDVCHFAVGYESHEETVSILRQTGIRVGKIQISAALKAPIPKDIEKREEIQKAFNQFNEPVYLHQVVARQEDGTLLRYPDLPEALADIGNPGTTEWRAHFHVPLFIEDYGILRSTQEDIIKILTIHQQQLITQHLEVETYTWEVLPEQMRLPVNESIVRELNFVQEVLKINPGGMASANHA